MTVRSALRLVLLLLIGVPAFGDYDLAAVFPHRGELAFLDPYAGIFRLAGGRAQKLVGGFEGFQAYDFASDGSSLYVTMVLRGDSRGPRFSRVRRWNSAGRVSGEWFVRQGGVLASVAVDSARQVAYGSDIRTGDIYRFSLNSGAAFTSIARIRDAGSIGPMVFDAARRRLLLADIQKGRIYAVTPDDGKWSVLLDSGVIIKPLALAFDATTGRLYIADGAKRKIWVGDATGAKLKVVQFTQEAFGEPSGVAVLRTTGGVSIWVADRGNSALLQFNEAGQKINRVKP